MKSEFRLGHGLQTWFFRALGYLGTCSVRHQVDVMEERVFKMVRLTDNRQISKLKRNNNNEKRKHPR